MITQATVDTSTNVVAATAIASPLWLGYAQGLSDMAEWALAPLGACWLLVQIILKIKEYRRGHANDRRVAKR
jgi:hypothetical protein